MSLGPILPHLFFSSNILHRSLGVSLFLVVMFPLVAAF